jgi:hypothetical protein
MDNPIVISLVVSGIGMLMLFVALTILYGLMYLMTWLAADRAPVVEDGGVGVEEWRAAVIAVALARAELEQSVVGTAETGEAVSAWRTLHHQRQLARNVPGRRVR